MATLATQPAYEEPIILDTEEIISDTDEPIIAKSTAPAHERIAVLAYAYWQESGCPEGTDEENWLRAEQELIASQ